MKIKHYLIVFFFGVLFTQNCLIGQQAYSQNEYSKEQNDSIRKVFIYSSVGVPELFTFGIGYQVSQEFAISVKQSVSFTGGGYYFPASASGLGAKISYYFPTSSVLFSCINFESIFYYELSVSQQPPPLIKGGFIDLSIGKEIFTKEGLRIFWGMGLYRSFAIGVPPVLSLSIKLGINYNFF